MKKWEYKLVTYKTKGTFSKNIPLDNAQSEFSQLGEEGWEYVDSQRVESNGWTDRLVFVFRREKESN
jgi:hypothetical protein